MARAVVTAGSAASFVLAAVAGVLGNQLTKDAVWAWVAFGVALVVGAGITAFVAHRSAPKPDPVAGGGSPGAPEQQAGGPASGAAVASAHEPEARTIEGPVARGNIILNGTYVAGHDVTITGTEGTRGSKHP